MRSLTQTLTSLAVMGGVLMGASVAYADSSSWTFTRKYSTESATTNYSTKSLTVSAGQLIKVSTVTSGTCSFGGGTSTYDTYLRLVDSSGNEVAHNDDAKNNAPDCSGLQSFLTYRVPTSGTYTIRAGCYGSTAPCEATVAWATGLTGVVFVHGTGDQLGALDCGANKRDSGTGARTSTSDVFNCAVPSAYTGYWTQAEVDAVRGGRPYLVTGQHGGTATPWNNPSPYKGTAGETGAAYEIANQIDRFLRGADGVAGTADDINDIVIVTHSGGSNQVRYILQHPTINSAFSNAKAAARKVITVAAPSMGTYLADRVFANDGSLLTLAGSALAGMMGFKDDGTYFIQTSSMASANADSAKFVNMSASQNGVPFYNTGGLAAAATCKGVTLFGACIGVMWSSLGSSYCDSAAMSTGLSALHNVFLYKNDQGTARNNCSDGFISCMSAQAIGTQFGYSLNQDHNQSRRRCNGEDSRISSQVGNVFSGFENTAYSASDVPVAQWDACGFSVPASVYYGSSLIGYTPGCTKSMLGDGKCDWDCVATYGHDAQPTWNANGTAQPGTWGQDDCVDVPVDTTAYPSGSGNTASNDPWNDGQGYTLDGSNSSMTAFDGRTKAGLGDNTVWFTDPLAGTSSALGQCPQSWIGDGYCDECVLALYGNDGNDCLPGHIAHCGGIIAQSPAYSTTSNPLYNEGDPTTNGTTWYFWDTLSNAGVGNGRCDIGECTRNKSTPCVADSDCSTGTCSDGYCSSSASTCNVDADCLTGSCVNGGCTTSGSDCSATNSSGVTYSLCR